MSLEGGREGRGGEGRGGEGRGGEGRGGEGREGGREEGWREEGGEEGRGGMTVIHIILMAPYRRLTAVTSYLQKQRAEIIEKNVFILKISGRSSKYFATNN